MIVINDKKSPNFGPKGIPVEFVVLHYTACSLERALEIFLDRSKKLCAHFVISEKGEVYDLGDFLRGEILQGAHAGESVFELKGKKITALNENSIGIEIVNLNGNLFSYTDAQYQALEQLIKKLQARFPALQDPSRIVGHEHIAGHRGKADPGLQFDWQRFFKSTYGRGPFPERKPICLAEDLQSLQSQVAQATEAQKQDPLFWSELSSQLEKQKKQT